MTAVPRDPKISELRELFRNLMEFRAVYEETGCDEIETPYGNRWSLWDLEYLLQVAQERLTLRQRQVITLCLVHGMREVDAAVQIGVSPSNPVMMYATLGIRRLLDLIAAGELDRFHQQKTNGAHAAARSLIARQKLVDRIRQTVRYSAQGCWVYPTRTIHDAPLIRIPSIHSSSRFRVVNAAYVTYEHYVRPVPPTQELVHKMPAGHFFKVCINPEHFTPELTLAAKREQQLILRKFMARRS